jgi:hypothetical protein
VDDLMSQDFNGAQRGNMQEDVKQQIIQLGLDYRLMTQFTSFVAVEEMVVTDGGQPRRIDVPVEVPEGVNRDTAYGNEQPYSQLRMFANVANAPLARRAVTKSGTNTGTGRGGNLGGGGRGAGGGGGVSAGALPTPKPGTGNFMMIDGVSEADAMKVLSPEEKTRAHLQSTFHPSVLAVIDRLKAKAAAGGDEAKFIRNGKAEIQIWLTEKTDETLAELKKLGFEVVLDPKTAKLVIGRLPIDKLAALAEMKFVRYVAPQIASN